MVEQDAPVLLSVPKAARLLSVCEATVWNMIKRGEISVVRLGGAGKRTLVPRHEIERIAHGG